MRQGRLIYFVVKVTLHFLSHTYLMSTLKKEMMVDRYAGVPFHARVN